ncbi:hypothetical protein SAMN05192541_17810 [Bradyrhizobium arachidis]|nr:hypothetical protein SAMN05192541_17810 [Bradyrhizobium arachidis]
MPKTLLEFRAQNLRLLEQLCPDDPRYIQSWIKQFDEQNGIRPEAPQKRGTAPRTKTVSLARTN